MLLGAARARIDWATGKNNAWFCSFLAYFWPDSANGQRGKTSKV